MILRILMMKISVKINNKLLWKVFRESYLKVAPLEHAQTARDSFMDKLK
jgi:hypothetical protein